MDDFERNNIVGWKVPTNIALIKYWGKKAAQIPQNPSLSISLTNSYTETKIVYVSKESKNNSIDLDFYFDGKKNSRFEERIAKYFFSLQKELPFLIEYKFTIHSKNSFPHSSGIASSASSMASIALCLMSIHEKTNHLQSDNEFLKKASYFARLGSGSAARSVYGEYALWGKTELFKESSDLYAIPINNIIHDEFKLLRLAVLLVSSKEKEISSSRGHELMNNHPFANARFEQAKSNLGKLVPILKKGDKKAFFEVVENEALSLHATMLSSNPSYILLKPNSLKIIEKIKKARKDSNLEIGFTIDAGANIHFLYFENQKEKVHHFIKSSILQYCENSAWIDDQIGNGPIEL